MSVATKIERLRGFIAPVKEQWQNPELKSAISSYEGFCQLMALDKAQRYLANHQVHQVKDWGGCELDAEGLALQAELEERQKASSSDRETSSDRLLTYCRCYPCARRSHFLPTLWRNWRKTRSPSWHLMACGGMPSL